MLSYGRFDYSLRAGQVTTLLLLAHGLLHRLCAMAF
jgi:hypothetical protein